MKKIKINSRITIELEDGFKKVKLPFFRKWVNALESGKFKQGKGQLYKENPDRYCCLGVLCKVQGVKIENESLLKINNPCYAQLGESGKLPDGAFTENCENWNLALLNDSGVKFKTIAKIIKTVWKA